MYIQLCCAGKIKERYWRDALSEYEKRLLRYHSLDIIEITDEPDPPHQSEEARLALLLKEAERFEKKINPKAFLIALDVQGQTLSSEAFAHKLNHLEAQGLTHLCFLIGSSHGLHPELLKKANMRLSISAMTLPHQLCRVFFLEQLYRAARINTGAPYHK